MRALIINAVCGIKSTGRICTEQLHDLESQGYEVKIAFGRDFVPEQYLSNSQRIGNNIDICWHYLMTRIFDDRGRWSRNATRHFLLWATQYDPDVLLLHNLHDYYINVELLFEWIKERPSMHVRWLQHDCWAFTGGCFHYQISGCNQWADKCTACPCGIRGVVFPNTARNFIWKKKVLSDVNDMTIIAPSQWMKKQIQQSFLNQYPVQVINNTINTEIFQPSPSNFREKMRLEKKTIVLGVASVWSNKKGLGDFIKLAEQLDERFVIMLVGLSEKQIKTIPHNIIAINRTNNARQLAEIYTAADVFLNLTYEDTYPTVNLEAQACGTPVITYKTGGSPESVPKENVVQCGDLKMVKELLNRIGDLEIIEKKNIC